jgi:hypothetical protein
LLALGVGEVWNTPTATSQESIPEKTTDFSALISQPREPVFVEEPTSTLEKIEIIDYQNIKEGSYGGQCVEWLKKYFHTASTAPEFKGHASKIKPNTKTPEAGDIVLTKEGEGHVALVIGIENNNLILAESNFKGDERITLGRELSTTSPKIRGYFKIKP